MIDPYERPRYFRGEKEAIDEVIVYGQKWGFGNLISHLQQAWSELLQKQGIDKKVADIAAGTICVWCKTDRRTGKKVKL